MNARAYLFATVFLAIFIFIYEWLVHGFLLIDHYEQTKEIWRSQAQMQGLFPLPIFFTLALSFCISYLFIQNYEDRGWLEGLRFGLYLGLIMAVLAAQGYSYLPISFELCLLWFVSSLVEGLGAGLVLAMSYHQEQKAA